MGIVSQRMGASRKALCWAIALVALAGAAVEHNDVADLDNEGVEPLAELEVLETKNAKMTMRNLKNNVKGATSVKQVKAAMKKTIRNEVLDKKSALLKKAEHGMKKAAKKEGKKMKHKMLTQMKSKVKSKVKASADNQHAKENKAKARLARAKAKRKAAERKVAQMATRKKLTFNRKKAEEKAKTATASRIAAEEDAKAAAAGKVTAEENAKKSAALKIAAQEQAKAAQKSPIQLRSMEAQAFEAAARLKQKEAQALAKVAALKSGQDASKQVNAAVASEATDKGALGRAKAKLQKLVTSANRSLRRAQAKPFSKSALKAIVKKRGEVKVAKMEVIRLTNKLKGDKATVKRDKPSSKIAKKASKRVAKISKKGKKYDLKHPNLKHMTKKQIKYWSHKKMKWRAESPLKKTKVMAKIFAVKNQEAATLVKMNELNTRIGMKSKGIRAAMLRKGRTAIVNGELIKPKANFHIKTTFQGQKGKHPRQAPPTRNPKTDKLKTLRKKHLKNNMMAITKKTDKALAKARSAAKDNGKPIGKKSVTTLKDLKKAVKINKKAGVRPTLGDDLEDNAGDEAAQDEADADAVIQRGDDDALSDDTDVEMAMDATDVESDVDSIDRD